MGKDNRIITKHNEEDSNNDEDDDVDKTLTADILVKAMSNAGKTSNKKPVKT